MAIEAGPRQWFLRGNFVLRNTAGAVLPCVLMLAQFHESG